MVAGPLCDHLSEAILSPSTTINHIIPTYWTSACKFLSADQASSFQLDLESPDDQSHADQTNERCSTLKFGMPLAGTAM
jgi:hypothetical protein